MQGSLRRVHVAGRVAGDQANRACTSLSGGPRDYPDAAETFHVQRATIYRALQLGKYAPVAA